MSHKRKKRKFEAKRQERRSKHLAECDRLVNGVKVPFGAVAADKSQQVPNNSYSPPPDYYVDIEFTCKDCGRKEIWTAENQKWYYEVAKGSLYATAVRCRDCRLRHRDQARGPGSRGDPNPIKHLGTLMKHLRRELEPAMFGAGFSFDGQKKFSRFGQGLAWLDYSRQEMLFRILFERHNARLVAEVVDEESGHRNEVITDMDAPRSQRELMERIDEFSLGVRRFLAGLPAISKRSEELGKT